MAVIAPSASPAPPDATGRDPRAERGDRVPTLDGWRAAAVLWVIVCHHDPEKDPSFRILHTLVDSAVEVFFCLSGYLLASHLLAQRAHTGRAAFWPYLARRAFRIVPALLAFLAALAFLEASGAWHGTREEWTSSALFYRNYASGSWETGHLWTLSVEAHFYLLLPILLAAASVRRRLWVLPLLCVGVAAWRLVATAKGWGVPRGLGYTDVRLDILFAGMWVAVVFTDASRRARIAAWLTPAVWGTAFSLLVLVSFLPGPVRATCSTVLIPLVVFGTVLHPEWRGSRFLESTLMRWLGALSFSLYLFQQIFVRDDRLIAGGIFLILPAAVVVHYLVERPGIELGRELLARRWTILLAPRTWPVIALAIGVSIFVANRIDAPARGEIPSGATVVVYEHDGFVGRFEQFGLGPHDLSVSADIANDSTSSLVVGLGAEAAFCSDVVAGRGAGPCLQLGPGTVMARMPIGWNDRISFLHVQAANRPR